MTGEERQRLGDGLVDGMGGVQLVEHLVVAVGPVAVAVEALEIDRRDVVLVLLVLLVLLIDRWLGIVEGNDGRVTAANELGAVRAPCSGRAGPKDRDLHRVR